MKNIYNNIKTIFLLSIITLALGSCSSDDFTEPYEAGIPLVIDYEDAIQIDVDQSTNYVTFSFKGKGVMPVWIIDGNYTTEFTTRKYYRKAGNYSVDVKIANANGMSDGVITKTFTIDKTIMNGFGGFVYDSQFNMWKKATIKPLEFFYAPGWTQITDPAYTFNDGTYNIKLPEATTETWQTQVKIGSDINTSVGTQYDFSVILTSSTNHSKVTVKLVDGANPDLFYFTKTVSLTANEPLCVWANAMEGIDITNLMLVVDFGGNAANTDVTIENIVFKNHADNDGTIVPEEEQVPEPNWADVNSAGNMWYGVKFTNEFFYAPGWAQLPNPAFTVDGSQYSLEFPEATFETWQNQVKFITEGLSTTSTEDYDFRVTLKASNNVTGATIKMAQYEDDNNTILFTQNIDLLAGEDVILKVINTPGVDMSKAMLIFDFGGNPANTNITIKDVILQVHKD